MGRNNSISSVFCASCINESVVQELPRVEEQLVELLNHYESSHGQTLLINGQDYRFVVSQQWVDYEEQKENEKLQRVFDMKCTQFLEQWNFTC